MIESSGQAIKTGPRNVSQNPLLTNILVLTDFSSCSQRAVQHALAIARYYNAELILLHVILPEHFPLKDTNTVPDTAWRDMRNLEATLPQGIPHRVFVEQGKPWPVISAFLKKSNAGLIVMGTHGRSNLKIFFLGSFAETVFRRAKCPVLTVGPKSYPARPNFTLKNVLLATDLSEESQAAEPYAFSLALRSGANLSLLNVVKPRWRNKPEADEERLRYAGDRLRAAASYEASRRLGPLPNLITEVGPVGDTIVKVAVRLKADLVVLGVSAPRALADRLGETPAYRVVCAAPCPALTIREASPVDYFKRLFAMMPKNSSLAAPPIHSFSTPPYCWWC